MKSVFNGNTMNRTSTLAFKNVNCQLSIVANCIAGYRIGKGKGYADLEFAMLVKMGAVNQNTVLAATVHDCQVHRQL